MMTIFSNMQTSEWVTLCLGIAAFGTAIWSNVIAHRALRTSGEQKLAEFRKEWIENLRTHFAEFVAATYSRAAAQRRIDVFAKKNVQLAREWREKYMQFTEEMQRHRSYIRLCLNLKEKAHETLIEMMEKYTKEKLDLASRDPELHELAQAAIKKEWDELKSKFPSSKRTTKTK